MHSWLLATSNSWPPIKHKISEAEGSKDATLHELEEEGAEDEEKALKALVDNRCILLLIIPLHFNDWNMYLVGAWSSRTYVPNLTNVRSVYEGTWTLKKNF